MVKKRINKDNYPTPRVHLKLLALHEDLSCDKFLEPAAGDGRIFNYVTAREVNAIEIRDEAIDAIKKNMSIPSHPITEIRNIGLGDFLETEILPNKFDLIVTNPPYSHAFEFVQKCVGVNIDGEKTESLLNPGGRCVMLLRAGFLETQNRYPFHCVAPLRRVWFLTERPKFLREYHEAERQRKIAVIMASDRTPGGKVRAVRDVKVPPHIAGTDFASYAWFVWEEGYSGPWTGKVISLKGLKDT